MGVLLDVFGENPFSLHDLTNGGDSKGD